jgi:hypothetical protein
MPDDFTITRVTEEPYLENGVAKARMLIEFKVGIDGPFFERFPKDGFDETTARLKLSAFARQLTSLRG